jgi:hypothetical protein
MNDSRHNCKAKHLKSASVAFFFALEYYSLQFQGAQWRLHMILYTYRLIHNGR